MMPPVLGTVLQHAVKKWACCERCGLPGTRPCAAYATPAGSLECEQSKAKGSARPTCRLLSGLPLAPSWPSAGLILTGREPSVSSRKVAG